MQRYSISAGVDNHRMGRCSILPRWHKVPLGETNVASPMCLGTHADPNACNLQYNSKRSPHFLAAHTEWKHPHTSDHPVTEAGSTRANLTPPKHYADPNQGTFVRTGTIGVAASDRPGNPSCAIQSPEHTIAYKHVA